VFLDCDPRDPAQQPAPRDDVDRCDFDYLRTEITYIDYVRDRKQAEVHVLVTMQETASGGTEWTVKFLGHERFAGSDQTLTFTTPQTATDDEERRAFARTFTLGLARYVAETPLADRIRITFEPAEAEQPAAHLRDPWNFWFFRTELVMMLESEDAEEQKEFGGTFTASRTTEAWRINVIADGEYEDERFTFSDGEQFRNASRDVGASALVVKSLSPRWSAGLRGNVGADTFLNLDLGTRVGPAIEFDVFPYAEWTRRRWTFHYTLGVNQFQYDEVTIFDKLEETLWDHALVVSAGARQPWGSLDGAAVVSQYLDEPDKYRISLNVTTNVRLFKGFEFFVTGNYDRIRDQVYLPKGEASDEEVLVRRRQLATNYQYFAEFGISYSFGSIFNNIVNPRMSGNSGIAIFQPRISRITSHGSPRIFRPFLVSHGSARISPGVVFSADLAS
jgi:hypothetical protein